MNRPPILTTIQVNVRKHSGKQEQTMLDQDILQHYNYLMRLAAAKGLSQADAEDLVGDAMLAAFAYIRKGNAIQHPKTWLANTFYHKCNDHLRKKYRSPITVCLDDCFDIPDTAEEEFLTSDEASAVRRELNHLAYITREALIRFYYGNQSVTDIAKGLNIPEGTVKSRLSTGRYQIKKGLETMDTRENCLPGTLYLSYGGADGPNGEPMSLVEGDLIAQNLLILAYEKPLTVSELSKAIGIPAAYIEPIIQKLVNGELMVQMESGKVYTDFIIDKPEYSLANFKAQLDFAHQHFDTVWSILQDMLDTIRKLTFVQNMPSEERTKLERYALLKSLQDFQHYGTDTVEPPSFPNRKDGGRWLAQAIAIEAGYDTTEYRQSLEFAIHGGHRTSRAVAVNGVKEIRLYEFDTTLWDCPHRYGATYELYFRHIIPLLWHIRDNIPLANSDIPNEFIAYMPALERFGLIGHTQDNQWCIKIPTIEKADYDIFCDIIRTATAKIQSAIGKEFASFLRTKKTPIPKHLTSVPELYRYHNATKYFVMSIIREAYEKGLHLNGVNYCCPPVIMVYEELLQ